MALARWRALLRLARRPAVRQENAQLEETEEPKGCAEKAFGEARAFSCPPPPQRPAPPP